MLNPALTLSYTPEADNPMATPATMPFMYESATDIPAPSPNKMLSNGIYLVSNPTFFNTCDIPTMTGIINIPPI